MRITVEKVLCAVKLMKKKVLRARGKMLRNKANGPADCLVTEMLQCVPTETVYEVAP